MLAIWTIAKLLSISALTFLWEAVQLDEVVSAVVDVVLAAQGVVLGAQEHPHVRIGRLVAAHVDAVGEGLVVETCEACPVVDVCTVLRRIHVHHVVNIDVEVVEVSGQLSNVHIINSDLNIWECELTTRKKTDA